MATITNNGHAVIARIKSDNSDLSINRFILANIPGLDYTQPVDPDQTIPDDQYIIDEFDVSAFGYVSPNKVVYSLLLGTTIGDFTFNFVGLLSSEDELVAASYIPEQTKYQTSGTLQGNNLTRNFLLEFDNAKAITNITVSAETWQLDFNQRLNSIDQREKMAIELLSGSSLFFNDAFSVYIINGEARISTGQAIVGGCTVELEEEESVGLISLPTRIWLDVSPSSSDSQVSGDYAIIISATQLSDYVDNTGRQHRLVSLCSISSTEVVSDERKAIDNRSLYDHTLGLINRKANISHGHVINDISGLSGALEAKSDNGHGHAMNDISGLSGALEAKSDNGHGHAMNDISGLSGALEAKSNNGHGHAMSDITGLSNALDAKAGVGHGHGIPGIFGLSDALDAKSNTGHGHAMNDISGLSSALDAKANSSHSHAMNNVSGLSAALDAKANNTHSHAMNDISGLSGALEAKANNSHTHEMSEINNLVLDLSLKANTNHQHPISDIANLQAILDQNFGNLMVKTVDEAKSNDTELATDADIGTWLIEANKTYALSGILYVYSLDIPETDGDIKIRILSPTSVDRWIFLRYIQPAVPGTDLEQLFKYRYLYTGNSIVNVPLQSWNWVQPIEINGNIRGGDEDAFLYFQWAQINPTTAKTELKRGSWIKLQELRT